MIGARPARGIGLCAIAMLAVVAAVGPSPRAVARAADDPYVLRPKADVAAAMRGGIAYLVGSQRKDGSWGSTASNLYDIYAPAPGSYLAFQVASTGLALSALLEAGDGSDAVRSAIRRAEDFLLANHAKARRVAPDTLYNVWAHAYALEAFARRLAQEKDPERRAALLDASRRAVDLLVRFESVNGGWGYYDFDGAMKQPGQFTTSFTTATVLIALHLAKEQGVLVPENIVKRGLALVRSLRNPNGAYGYSWDHRYYPQGGINKVKGSLARTPVCDLALLRWGDDVGAERIDAALGNLDRLGHFLRIARKYPVPHETWYQNSGYFCFYGYYYASWLLDRLETTRARPHAAKMVADLLPLQEEDGSWWDYQLYGYHKAYGTAYVLLTLARCR